MNTHPSINADMHSEVIGYLFQALGLAIFSLLVRLNKDFSKSYTLFSATSIVCIIIFFCSIHNQSLNSILILGYIANTLIGIIAGFYLIFLTKYLPAMQRGVCFGVGYSIGSLGSYLLSIISKNNFLTSQYVFIPYIILIIISIVLTCLIIHSEEFIISPVNQESKNTYSIVSLVILTAFAALMLSLVKNIGFYFPLADVKSGVVNLEFSRLFYALGLTVAGIINDINRKYGIFACLISLVFPFLLLFLSVQYQSSITLWILGYILTGFYTVYRVLLLGDLSNKNESLLYIASFGLLFGRIGDAVGAFIGINMTNNINILIVINVVFYITTAIIVMLIFERIYIPDILKERIFSVSPTENSKEPKKEDSSKEESSDKLEAFAEKYALSKREKEVLKLALTDMTNSNIAEQLFISENTTKFHIRNILKKTCCSNKNELRSLYLNIHQ